jgi:hypothetical protein
VLESQEDQEVVQGLTSHMEMCDFFLFFWTDIRGLSLAQVKWTQSRKEILGWLKGQ